MKYKAVKLKKFLKIINKNSPLAMTILDHQPNLATAKWQGKPKRIPGSTALHWAAHNGQINLVKKLLELGANINADNADWWCRPIDWAADSGQYKVVQYLIDQGALIEGDKWSNCTPLHVVAQGGSRNGKKKSKAYRKTAKVLIKAGVPVNSLARYGGQPPPMTPLDDARKVGNVTVETVLIKHGGKTAKELSAS